MQTLRILGVVLVLLALALAPLHHHEDGLLHSDCALCRLSQEIFSFFLVLLFVFLFSPARSRQFAPVVLKKYRPLYLTSKLRDRAPPSFS